MAVQRLIKRCLKKDPTARLHDIADAGLEIEDAVAESAPLVVQMPGVDPWRVSRKRAADRGCGGARDVGARSSPLGFWLAGRHAAAAVSESVSRVVLPVPAGQQVERGGLAPLAISPDGARLVYVAVQGEGRTQLFMRPLDRFEPTALAGTEGASAPFFSPDGRVGRLLRQRLPAARVGRRRRGAQDLRHAGRLERDVGRRRHDRVRRRRRRRAGLWRVPVGGGDARTPDDRRMPRTASCSTPTRSVCRTATCSSASRPIAGGTSRCSRSGTSRCARSASLAAAAPARSTCRRPATCSTRMPADSWPCRSIRLQGMRPGRRFRSSSARRSIPRAARAFAVSASGTLVYIPRAPTLPSRALVMVDRERHGRRSCPTRAPRTRIRGCRPTAAASPSPSNRRTAPTSGSTISSAAPRRRS